MCLNLVILWKEKLYSMLFETLLYFLRKIKELEDCVSILKTENSMSIYGDVAKKQPLIIRVHKV